MFKFKFKLGKIILKTSLIVCFVACLSIGLSKAVNSIGIYISPAYQNGLYNQSVEYPSNFISQQNNLCVQIETSTNSGWSAVFIDNSNDTISYGVDSSITSTKKDISVTPPTTFNETTEGIFSFDATAIYSDWPAFDCSNNAEWVVNGSNGCVCNGTDCILSAADEGCTCNAGVCTLDKKTGCFCGTGNNCVCTKKGFFRIGDIEKPENLKMNEFIENRTSEILDQGETYDDTPTLSWTLNLAGEISSNMDSETAGGLLAGSEDEVIIRLYSNGLVGYLWAKNAGWILLDSDGIPGSTNTGSSEFGVNRNGENFSGAGWSEGGQWIFFSCEDMQSALGGNSCETTLPSCTTRVLNPDNFNVCIDSEGKLHGHAWSTTLGWLSFEGAEIAQPLSNIQIVKVADPPSTPAKNAGLFESSFLSKSMRGYSFTLTSAIPDGTYFWRVRKEENEKYSLTDNNDTDIKQFTVKSDPTAVQILPANNADSTQNPLTVQPEFQFSLADKIGSKLRYELIVEKCETVDSVETCSVYKTHNNEFNVASEGEADEYPEVKNISYTFPSSIEAGKYRWKVKVTDDGYNTHTTDYWIFYMASIGDPPIINCITPVHSSSISDRTPNLEFSIFDLDDTGGEWQVILSENEDLSEPLATSNYTAYPNAGLTINANYEIVNELEAKNYYWQIEAKDADNNASFKTCQFTVTNTPPVITNVRIEERNGTIIPDGGGTYDPRPVIRATFTDDSSQANLSCQAEIALDSQFNVIKWSLTKENAANECVFNIESPLTPDAYPNTYYWRVNIIDADGESVSANEPAWTFVLNKAADNKHGNIGTKGITNNIVHNEHKVPLETIEEDKLDHKHAYNINNIEGDSGVTVGWLNFNPNTGGVYVFDDYLLGYAWNDDVGWLRMNCQDSDIIGIDDDNICGASGFGVSNNKGVLSGKAYFEQFGGYLYFNETACIADNTCVASTNFKVEIDSEGKFSGYAWSPELGWFDFNGADVSDVDDDSMNYFYPITEWFHDATPPIITLDDNADDYYVFTASAEKTIELAKDADDQDYGFYCPGGLFNPNIDDFEDDLITLELESADGSVDVAGKYLFACSDKRARDDHYAKLNISLNGVAGSLSEIAGVYRLSGNIADTLGNVVSISDNANNEIYLHIVAAKPDFTMENTLVNSTIGNVYASGDDNHQFIVDIRDSYDNPIQSEEVEYGSSAGNPIKTVKVNAKLLNTIDADQFNNLDNDGAPVFYYDFPTYLPKNRNVGNYDEVQISNGGMSSFSIRSFAPTSLTNDRLIFEEIIVDIDDQEDDYYDTGTCVSAAECSNNIDTILEFLPMLTTEFIESDGEEDFSEVIFMENQETILTMKAKNNVPSKPIDLVSWMVEMNAYDRTLDETDENWSLNQIVFADMRLVKEGGDDLVENQNYCSYDSSFNFDYCVLGNTFEEAARDYNADPFRPDDGIMYGGILNKNLLYNTYRSSWNGNIYNLAFTEKKKDEVLGQDAGIRFTDYISYINEDYNIIYPIRYQVNKMDGAMSFIYRDIAVEGVSTGEKIYESAVINPEAVRFVGTGKTLSFQTMFKAIEENVEAAIRGRADPAKHQVAGTNISVSNWAELAGNANAEILKNGQVVWFHGDDFTLNITGDLIIPAGSDAFTLIVDGGNIYLEGNIVSEGHPMAGNGMLGIIVRNTKQSNEHIKSGNFLIHPDVTNIKASLLAEKSIMSYDSLNGIYDGFNTNNTSLPKQLYWKGTMMTRNTVGGAEVDEESGKVPEIPDYNFLWMPATCTQVCFNDVATDLETKVNTAKRFDLIHLRHFTGTEGYESIAVPLKFNKTSTIIEYDDNIIHKTPPLFGTPRDIR